jgi:hypothetical protein
LCRSRHTPNTHAEVRGMRSPLLGRRHEPPRHLSCTGMTVYVTRRQVSASSLSACAAMTTDAVPRPAGRRRHPGRRRRRSATYRRRADTGHDTWALSVEDDQRAASGRAYGFGRDEGTCSVPWQSMRVIDPRYLRTDDRVSDTCALAAFAVDARTGQLTPAGRSVQRPPAPRGRPKARPGPRMRRPRWTTPRRECGEGSPHPELRRCRTAVRFRCTAPRLRCTAGVVTPVINRRLRVDKGNWT